MIAVGELAKAIHPTKNKDKLILVLIAYIDESGHSSDPNCRFVGLGGLVATSENWEHFEVKWKNALEEFIEGEPFHMMD